MVLSETFWVAFVSTMSASCLVAIRWGYRSKCSHVRLCCIDIERDVHGEEQLDRTQLPSSNSSNKMERSISL